jgi:cytosine/adenosine deaminase-related metal-dependent hydrolase
MIVRHALLAALLAGGSIAAPAAAQRCDAPPLLIRNVGLWTRDGVVAGRDVLFRDGRVSEITPTRSRPTAASDGSIRTIDGTGHTLLPGLVDAHLHLSIPGGLPPPPGGGARTDTLEITGRQLLRSGVTSGRLHLTTVEEAASLGARSAGACAPLPRLQSGGPGLSGAAERDHPAFQGAKTPEDAMAKIARAGARGIDWVAIHDADRFPEAVRAVLAGAARQHGVRLLAAGSTPAEIMAALALKPDTLDYFDRTDQPYPASVLAAMRAQRDLVLVPMPGVPYRTAAYAARPARLEDPANFEFLSDADRAFVLANAKTALAGADAERARRIVPQLAGKFAQLRSLGLPMAVGSDAGSPLHFQAGAIWWELEAWRAAGVPHREALVAATEHAAGVLRAPDVGRLTAGSRADFVLYRGNVEDGPFEQGRVIAVGKGGVLFVADGRWVGPPITGPD